MKNTSEIRQDVGLDFVVGKLSKTHKDYWKGRLRKRTYAGADGLKYEIATWQISMGHAGRHRWINLGTANKDSAAEKARDTWVKLKGRGWDALGSGRDTVEDPTVGDFLAAVRAESDLNAGTFEIYAKKFRRLVAGAFGVRADKQKHDYVGGGHDKWLARIHAVKFSRLTARAVQKWKTRFIAAAGGNPLRERRARRTVASILRSSKALFAPDVIKRLHLKLPVPLPLADVEVPRVSASQYVSRFTPSFLLLRAQQELETPSDEILRAAAAVPCRMAKKSKRKFSDAALENRVTRAIERERIARPQMYRVVCLGLFAGLRRDEVDTLTWSQIDFAQQSIRVETNEYTHAKSEGSEAGIDIDPTFSELLRSWMKASQSKFVVEGDVDPRPEVTTYHHYRCDRIFHRVTAWLKNYSESDDGKAVHPFANERYPLHVLRKEFGTQINRTHGLFAASSQLRHSSIQLTRSVYVAKKDRAVFAMPGASAQSVGSEKKAPNAAIGS